jgi:hypothetical protein
MLSNVDTIDEPELIRRNLRCQGTVTPPRLYADHRTNRERNHLGTWFYEALGSSEGMVTPQVGTGQVFMTTKRDSRGSTLRADKTYRLRVPKDVPVGQF